MPRTVPISQVRNIGIMAHIDAGKTTCSERILYFTGKIHRPGEVHDGEAQLDWMPQERERGITITSAATTTMWRDHQITLIDTPGHVDFTVEVERSLRVLDGAIALFCAVGGVEPQSEKVWRQSEKYNIPKIAFINKMDRVGADFFGVLKEIETELGAPAVPIVLPLGQEEQFHGLIDLLTWTAVVYDDVPHAVTFREIPIPEEHLAMATEWRQKLMEKCAETDEELLELYLERGELSREDLEKGLRRATLARRLVPVYCGSAFRNKGIRRLLDGIVQWLPSPVDLPPIICAREPDVNIRYPSDDAPFCALAFKTTADRHMGKLTYLRVYSGRIESGATVLNSTRERLQRLSRLFRMHANRQEVIPEAFAGDIVAAAGLHDTRTGDTLCDPSHPIHLEAIEFPSPVVSISIAPESRGDSERLAEALHRLADEDPTFTVGYDAETSETIISGMGELHLEIIVDRLRREFEVAARVGRPEVAYRETLTLTVEGEGRYIKQTGGRGQYGHVVLRLEPLPPGGGFEFVNEIVGGRIPASFIPSVEKGLVKAMRRGPLAGYPVVDLRAILLDGSYHEVDSSDLAFQEAAQLAFRRLFLQGNPRLLEPVMSVEIVTPEEFMGACASAIGQRRGRIEAIERKGSSQILEAQVPLAEMFGFATVLRTLTQGRATFSMHFEYYDAVPQELAEVIVEKRRRQDRQ